MSDPRSSLGEQAYEALEHLLVTRAWPPGVMVSERELIDATGIGRTPVREAVQRLAADGLLRVLPRKGLQVTPLLRSDLRQVLEVRRPLERLVARAAAERADPAARAGFGALAQRLGEEGADREAFYRLDRALDRTLLAAAGNPHAANALAPLRSQCRRFAHEAQSDDDRRRAARLHADLAACAGKADGAGAERACDGIIDLLEAQLKAMDDLG